MNNKNITQYDKNVATFLIVYPIVVGFIAFCIFVPHKLVCPINHPVIDNPDIPSKTTIFMMSITIGFLIIVYAIGKKGFVELYQTYKLRRKLQKEMLL